MNNIRHFDVPKTIRFPAILFFLIKKTLVMKTYNKYIKKKNIGAHTISIYYSSDYA